MVRCSTICGTMNRTQINKDQQDVRLLRPHFYLLKLNSVVFSQHFMNSKKLRKSKMIWEIFNILETEIWMMAWRVWTRPQSSLAEAQPECWVAHHPAQL